MPLKSYIQESTYYFEYIYSSVSKSFIFLGIWNRKKIGFHFKTFPFQTTSHITEYVIMDNGLFQLYIVMDIKIWVSGIKYLKPGFWVFGIRHSWENEFLGHF